MAQPPAAIRPELLDPKADPVEVTWGHHARALAALVATTPQAQRPGAGGPRLLDTLRARAEQGGMIWSSET